MGAALNLPVAVAQAVTRVVPPLLLRLDAVTLRRARVIGREPVQAPATLWVLMVLP